MLDNSEQPEDQDQQQEAAKTDIHIFPPYSFVGRFNRQRGLTVPFVSAAAHSFAGMILPIRKRPLFLDFLGLSRK
jgi:hypothetical protein